MAVVARLPRPGPAGGARHPRGRGSVPPPGTGPCRPGPAPGPGRAGARPATRRRPPAPTGRTMTLWERVVQANRPGPPEHSVPFRVASAGTVIIAIAACWSQGEVSLAVALFGIAATGVGNVLSYWRREHPWPAVKPILAVCAVGGFVWFIATVSHNATPGDISTVESPLAVLFAWVLCTHAFDVPARRDVAYSLAGSAALMAVAAAQSVDLTLGVYVRGVGGLRPVGPGGHVAVHGRCPGRPLDDSGGDRCGGGRGGPTPGVGTARPEGVHLADLPVVGGQLVVRRLAQQPDRRVGVAAGPRGQPQRPHRGGRLPGLRQVPRHRGPGLAGQRGGAAGPGRAGPASGWGRPTTTGTARAGSRPRTRPTGVT